MRIADWNDYELIDTSAGERLERWGDVILIGRNIKKCLLCGVSVIKI